MEDRFVFARRRAMWRILLSGRTAREKLDALSSFVENQLSGAYRRGLSDGQRASALKAGKLRPITKDLAHEVLGVGGVV